MTGDFANINPDQNLNNIPHMLRYWALDVERLQEQGVEFAIAGVTLVEVGKSQPRFAVLGGTSDPHPLYAAGMFDYCRHMLVTHACQEEDDV